MDADGISDWTPSRVMDCRPKEQHLIPVRTRNSVRGESDKGEIHFFLLGQLLFLMPSHCNMIPAHQGHLNQHKVTETSTHKKPAHS